MIDLDAARELAACSDDMAEDHPLRRLLISIDDEYGHIWPGGGAEPEAASPKPPQTINGWAKAIHQYAKDKGWWDKPRAIGDIFMLFTSEVAEAYEEYRNGHEVTETYFDPEKPNKPEGVPTELADVIIRILDFCEWAGIDLQAIMEQKHAYNLTRAYRHGNKRT